MEKYVFDKIFLESLLIIISHCSLINLLYLKLLFIIFIEKFLSFLRLFSKKEKKDLFLTNKNKYLSLFLKFNNSLNLFFSLKILIFLTGQLNFDMFNPILCKKSTLLLLIAIVLVGEILKLFLE